jgi:hypothetical protein
MFGERIARQQAQKTLSDFVKTDRNEHPGSGGFDLVTIMHEMDTRLAKIMEPLLKETMKTA